MNRWLINLGARLGNWNDRHSKHDRRAEASLCWRVLDRIAGWLYVTPKEPRAGKGSE